MDEEDAMMALMGFGSFDTSKVSQCEVYYAILTMQGKKHEDVAAISAKPKREYRQYMNRRGGFNRPLDEA